MTTVKIAPNTSPDALSLEDAMYGLSDVLVIGVEQLLPKQKLYIFGLIFLYLDFAFHLHIQADRCIHA